MLHKVVVDEITWGGLVDAGPVFDLAARWGVSVRNFALFESFDSFELTLKELHGAQSFIEDLLGPRLSPLVIAVTSVDVDSLESDLFNL